MVYTNNECSSVSKPVTVTNSCDNISAKLKSYPNPSNGLITLTYCSNTAGNVQLIVYGKTGEILFAKTCHVIIGENNYQLNLSDLKTGLYHLQLNNGSEQGGVKLVIEK